MFLLNAFFVHLYSLLIFLTEFIHVLNTQINVTILRVHQTSVQHFFFFCFPLWLTLGMKQKEFSMHTDYCLYAFLVATVHLSLQ